MNLRIEVGKLGAGLPSIEGRSEKPIARHSKGIEIVCVLQNSVKQPLTLRKNCWE